MATFLDSIGFFLVLGALFAPVIWLIGYFGVRAFGVARDRNKSDLTDQAEINEHDRVA